jgi:basic membrane protein A and related proteins
MYVLSMILLAACTNIQTTPPSTQIESSSTSITPPNENRLIAIFPGVVTDADYNTLGYMAINEVSRDLNIETDYEESIAVDQIDNILREYIADGYNIIWAHGGQFVDSMVDLATHFPEVVFIAEGDEPVTNPPTNLWFIDRNFHLGFYLIGATAALATKTGKVGYLGGERLPFTYAEVHAAQQAIHDLGLERRVELIPVWVGDFNDPTKAGEFTESLVAQDVDFIMGSINLGMFGAFEAVKAPDDNKILITTKYLDKSGFVPDNYVTSLLYDFNIPLIDIVRSIVAGESGGYYPLDFYSGETLQLPFSNLDPHIEQQVTELLNRILDGSIQVIKDTSPIY